MSLSILKWICPPPETFEEPSQEDGKVEWFRCLPYVLIHLACLSASSSRYSALHYLSPFFLTVSECSRSRPFTTVTLPIGHSKQVVWFSLSGPPLLAARQRDPLWWAAHHRRHHRHSDTEKDSHSPNAKSFFWSHTFWFMTDYAVPTFKSEIRDSLKFRELNFLNRFDRDTGRFVGFGLLFFGAIPPGFKNGPVFPESRP